MPLLFLAAQRSSTEPTPARNAHTPLSSDVHSRTVAPEPQSRPPPVLPTRCSCEKRPPLAAMLLLSTLRIPVAQPRTAPFETDTPDAPPVIAIPNFAPATPDKTKPFRSIATSFALMVMPF